MGRKVGAERQQNYERVVQFAAGAAVLSVVAAWDLEAAPLCCAAAGGPVSGGPDEGQALRETSLSAGPAFRLRREPTGGAAAAAGAGGVPSRSPAQ